MNNYTSLVSGNFFKYQPYSEPNVLYVDLGGVNGIAHTGTASDPFRTLEYAITRVQAGQTIQLNPGIHYVLNEFQLPQYVNLRGVSQENTFLMPDPSIADITFRIVRAGDSGVDPENNPGFQEISGICFDGNAKAVGYGIHMRRRNNFHIHHCKFQNIYYSGIDMRNGTIPITDHAVNCSVHDNIFEDCAGMVGASTAGALQIEGFSEPDIYNNYFHVPATVARLGIPIKGWNGSHDGIKIHHNTIIKDFTDNDTDVGFSIELGQVYGGCEIYSNVIVGGAIDLVNTSLGRFSYGAKIHDNNLSLPAILQYTSDAMVFPCFTIERSNCGIYIYHNECRNYGRAIVMSLLTVTSELNNINIFYNKFINIGTANAVAFCRIIQHASDNNNHTYKDIRIFNNLIMGTLGGVTIGIWLPENAAEVRHYYIKNNIMLNLTSTPVWGRGGGAGYTPPIELEIDNNLIHNCGNVNNPLYDAGYTPDAGTYTFDNNVQGVDPLFVNAAIFNFHLQAASPARDLGIVNYSVFEDFDNIPIKNQPNIGVYER